MRERVSRGHHLVVLGLTHRLEKGNRGGMRIPAHRDRPFRLIVTADSGARAKIGHVPTGIRGHDHRNTHGDVQFSMDRIYRKATFGSNEVVTAPPV